MPDYYLSDKDPRRKRRSSWQAKMERRRRKSLANTRIDENSVTIVMDHNADERGDDNGQGIDTEGENSSEYMNRGVGLPLGTTTGPYHRQKRHSWWNILVPDNFKASRWLNECVGVSALECNEQANGKEVFQVCSLLLVRVSFTFTWRQQKCRTVLEIYCTRNGTKCKYSGNILQGDWVKRKPS